MKAILTLTLALSCFVIVGNSQDSAERPTYGPAATAFDTQGNVAYNMSQAERELATAAQQARLRKEQMYERAAMSSAPPPPVPRTAAEYLAANKPPPIPEPLQPRNPVRTNRDYVPPFTSGNSPVTPEPGAVTTNNSPGPSSGMSKKEGGLFKLFGKKKKQADTMPAQEPVGASTYETTPYVEPGADTPSNPESAPNQPTDDSSSAAMDPDTIDALISEATVSSDSPPPADTQVGNGRNKGGLFGKLFKKRNDSELSVPAGAATSEPAPAPSGEMAATEAPIPPAPPAGNGEIPDPAAFDAPAPPAPAATSPPASDGPAPIFQRRSSTGATGSAATVSGEGSAMVNGVRVKLYQGTKVSVLSNSGGTAQIRLPDGRTGTMDSSLLQ